MITSRCVVTDDRMGSRDLRCRNAIVAVIATAWTLTACTHDGVNTQLPPPSPSTAVDSPTSTVDPAVLAVLAAYRGFNDSTNNALRHPFGLTEKPSGLADFARFTFDPLRAMYQGEIANLKLQGIAFRGTPPESHAAVTTINLTASPYPTAIVTDCQTHIDQWQAVYVKTGKVLPNAKVRVPPPYESTATVIYYQRHWGVKKIQVDSSRTCAR